MSASSEKSFMHQGEWNTVLLVCFINFLDSLGGSISTPILPFYAREFQASYSEVGVLFSGFAFAQTVALPGLSYLADRYGRRPVFLLSIIGSIAGSLWQGGASSYESLLAARMFTGVWAGVSGVCQIYIADVVPPELRPESMSFLLSSTQASTLFGPSIGAGLSALGLNWPVLVQGFVGCMLLPVVYVYLPESAEWCRTHGKAGSPLCSPLLGSPPLLASPATPHTEKSKQRTREKRRREQLIRNNPGLGWRFTWAVIGIYGFLTLCGMIAQMSIISMYAVFAKDSFGLNSLRVGFAMTLGAVASVGTNIWVSPTAIRRLGVEFTGILGFVFIVLGAFGTVVLRPLPMSLASLMLTYLGLAINSSAVATGAAGLTDWRNRSTVMTGVRMLKSLGAVLGPIISGHLAALDVRLPFACASGAALLGAVVGLGSIPLARHFRDLVDKRKNVGSATGLLEDGGWQDEQGTTEEIWDMGVHVTNILTTRHYRWITYNSAIKNFISDSLPEVPIESEEQHRQAYDRRRHLLRDCKDVDVVGLQQRCQEVEQENFELRQLIAAHTEHHERKLSQAEEEDIETADRNACRNELAIDERC